MGKEEAFFATRSTHCFPINRKEASGFYLFLGLRIFDVTLCNLRQEDMSFRTFITVFESFYLQAGREPWVSFGSQPFDFSFIIVVNSIYSILLWICRPNSIHIAFEDIWRRWSPFDNWLGVSVSLKLTLRLSFLFILQTSIKYIIND